MEREHGKQSIYGRTLYEEVARYARAAGSIARREKADIIHAHDWLTFGAGLHARKVARVPLASHVHATEFDRTGGMGVNDLVYNIERKGMHGSDHVVAVSNFTKNIITSRYGVPSEKVTVVHNGVEQADENVVGDRLAYMKAHGSKIVLFVGRLTLQKGPDYFLRAAARVLEYDPDVIFVVAGAGDMEYQIIRQAATLGIGRSVIFTGFLREEELASVYASADLYVLSSVSEPFGITPLEAARQGTPVLISKQSGVSEVFHHCLKADFWDTDEMANQIISVLSHPPLYETLRENGRQNVRQITWERTAKTLGDVYQSLLSKQYALAAYA
jgi:glycosyltransferase involved in cell wall biosynthesis